MMGDVAACEDLLTPSGSIEHSDEVTTEHAGPLSTSTDHDLSVRLTPSDIDNADISSDEEDLEKQIELTKVK